MELGHHFYYDRREGRIFTQYLLLANNKEHGPHPQEAAVWLEWQDIAAKTKNNSVCEKPTGNECCRISEESKINSWCYDQGSFHWKWHLIWNLKAE